MKSEIVIRNATADDFPACAKIVNDWIDESHWLPRIYTHNEIKGFFSEDLLATRTFLVAETPLQIAGYMAICKEAMIRAFYLGSKFRNCGIGRKFMNHAKSLFPHQLELGVFERNVDARRFYEREGFREVPEGRIEDTKEGVPELLLRWTGQTQ